MKKRSVHTIVLITMLLISQISNAYTSVNEQPDCGMDMSSHKVMEQSVVDENTTKQVNEHVDDMPDCCDKSGNNDGLSKANMSMSCCDDNCHCSGLGGTCLVLFSQTSFDHSYVSEALITFIAFAPTSPNLKQPLRPPLS